METLDAECRAANMELRRAKSAAASGAAAALAKLSSYASARQQEAQLVEIAARLA